MKQLFQQLAELHPALERHLDDGGAVAIDGQIYQDALLEPIGHDSEVFLLPQIAGGSHRSLTAEQFGAEIWEWIRAGRSAVEIVAALRRR